jgi:predicted esterase
MKISYEPYFEYLANNAGLEISHEVKKQIQLQVESAISVTIGARWFNVFHPRQSLPALNVPINVVAGMQDELVPLQLLQEASQLLIRKGYSVNFQTIEGGHLFPFKNPKETLDLIIK